MKKILELFVVFFKIGLFTFGGGYAMIPQIKEIIVEKKKWLSIDEVLEIIAIAETTPGPIAINMATFIGYRQKKFWGSLIATIGITLPSFIIIFVISLFLKSFLAIKIIQYAFIGIKCAIAFLIIKAGIEMLKKLEKKLYSIIIFIIVLILMILFEIFSVNFSSIVLILIGGVIGIFLYTISLIKRNKRI